MHRIDSIVKPSISPHTESKQSEIKGKLGRNKGEITSLDGEFRQHPEREGWRPDGAEVVDGV